MKTRLISALIAMLIFIPILFIGGTLFNVAVYIISVLGLYEFIKIKEEKKELPSFIKSSSSSNCLTETLSGSFTKLLINTSVNSDNFIIYFLFYYYVFLQVFLVFLEDLLLYQLVEHHYLTIY